MYSRTVKILLVFFVLCAIPCAAQTSDDAQKQKEEFEQKALENLTERIQTFLFDLKIDDFQKEIIKQKLHSYFAKKKVIYLDNTLKYYERDEQISSLGVSHFSDIKNMLSEDTMNQIEIFITDAGTTLEKQKNKNKKNKKKKNE